MKKLFSLLACTMMAISLTGCGSSGSSSKNVFNFASELDIISLDSTKANDGMSLNAIHAFTDGLMGRDKDGNTSNALAESYEVSDDGLT